MTWIGSNRYRFRNCFCHWIAAAGVALIATWWQDAPVPAILALVAAILGTGEVADRKKKKAQRDPE